MKIGRPKLPVALLLLAMALVAIVRIRLLTTPLERDEGEFAYAGQLILQGIPPYELVYNIKFPGMYAAYALLMVLFGQSPGGIHFGLLVVNAAATWMLYLLARWFLDGAGAAVAAASYVLLSASPVVYGLAAHATQFVVQFALAGLVLLLRGEKTGKISSFFWSGVLLGVACLMKQPGALFGLLGFGTLAARAWQDRDQRQGHAIRLVLYGAGFTLPLILTALVLWRAGVFPRFWFWTVVYAREHANVIPFAGGLHLLGIFFHQFPILADGLFWFMAVLGLASLFAVKGEWPVKLGLAGLLLVSLGAVSLANYFSRHYFIMLLPALCLLAGQAFSFARQRAVRGWSVVPSFLFIALWLSVLAYHRAIFFQLTPDEVCQNIYSGNPFVECRQIGLYLGQHSPPNARIAVLGSEPEILFYARRHSATGYIYMYDLTAPQPYASPMQIEMATQIEETQPEYLVFVGTPVSWDIWVDFQHVTGSTLVKSTFKLIQEHYEPAGLAIVKSNSEYYWGRDAFNHRPERGPYVSVFQRR